MFTLTSEIVQLFFDLFFLACRKTQTNLIISLLLFQRISFFFSNFQLSWELFWFFPLSYDILVLIQSQNLLIFNRFIKIHRFFSETFSKLKQMLRHLQNMRFWSIFPIQLYFGQSKFLFQYLIFFFNFFEVHLHGLIFFP